MDLGSLMSGLEGLAGPHAAEIGSHLGLSPAQVGEVLGHLGGKATAGQTDPHVAAQNTAQATGIDPAIVGQLVSALQNGGGLGGIIQTVQSNPAMLGEVMNLAKGFFSR